MKQQRKKSKRLINIKRWDSPQHRTHGWFVQVERRGTKYVKFFSDGIHSGKDNSLQAAIQYRDEIKRKAGAKYKIWRQSVIRKNNTSGIPGVARYVRMNKSGDTEQPYWSARWTDISGKQRSRKFAVSRYGEERARALAIQERTKHQREITQKIAETFKA